MTSHNDRAISSISVHFLLEHTIPVIISPPHRYRSIPRSYVYVHSYTYTYTVDKLLPNGRKQSTDVPSTHIPKLLSPPRRGKTHTPTSLLLDTVYDYCDSLLLYLLSHDIGVPAVILSN